jgi:hypothetical protein
MKLRGGFLKRGVYWEEDEKIKEKLVKSFEDLEELGQTSQLLERDR